MQSFQAGNLQEPTKEVVDQVWNDLTKLNLPLDCRSEIEFAEIRDRHRALCAPVSEQIVGRDNRRFSTHLVNLVDSLIQRSLNGNKAPRILPGERITGDDRPRNMRVMDLRGWLTEGKLKLAGLVQLRDHNHNSYYFDHTGYFPFSQGEIFMHVVAPSAEAVARAIKSNGSFDVYFIPLYTKQAFEHEVALLVKYSRDMFKQDWYPLLSSRVVNQMFHEAVPKGPEGSAVKPLKVMPKYRKSPKGYKPFYSIEYETIAQAQPDKQFLDLQVYLSNRTIRVEIGKP